MIIKLISKININENGQIGYYPIYVEEVMDIHQRKKFKSNNMKLKYPEKVELLKDAICVSGNRLLEKGMDLNRIDTQIDCRINMIQRTPDEIHKNCDRVMNNIDYNDSEDNVRRFIQEGVYRFVNLSLKFDSSFWCKFGSAPYYQRFENKKPNGGVGMDTIFGDKFEHCSPNDAENKSLTLFNEYLVLKKKKEETKLPNITSLYKNLDDIENNVVVKNINSESEIFWNDVTKDTKDRFEVFNKYGSKEIYIFEPSDRNLKKIFSMATEYDQGMMVEKYQTVKCLDIVEWWVNKLEEGRTIISYNENEYHPKIISKKRNYKVSNESMERLFLYYKLLVMKEGVSEFKMDW